MGMSKRAKCRLANAFTCRENDNSVFSVNNSHEVHTELVEFNCFFVGLEKKRHVYESIMLWPYTTDGFTPVQRWEKNMQDEAHSRRHI